MTDPLEGQKYRLLHGDALTALKTLPANSVQCCVTSPPFFNLRSYLDAGHPDKASEIGLEADPAAFVARLVAVFGEVKRVLHPSGTLWLNMGDSYSGSCMTGGNNSLNMDGGEDGFKMRRQFQRPSSPPPVPPKNLLGIPWRLAFALQDAGWILRQDIIWSKSCPMPESVRDRCTKAHEYLFLLAKRPTYYFDSEAIAESSTRPGYVGDLGGEKGRNSHLEPGDPNYRNGHEQMGRTLVTGATRNRRSVWTVANEPSPYPHFAAFPTKLVEPCVAAGSSPKGCCSACGNPWRRVVERESIGDGARDFVDRGDDRRGRKATCGVTTVQNLGWEPTCAHDAPTVPATVMDIFCGTGTTCEVALAMGRRAIGIDLSADYLRIAKQRCETLPTYTGARKVVVPKDGQLAFSLNGEEDG